MQTNESISGNIPATPGALLGELLREMQITQSDFASKLGVTRQYVNAVLKDNESLSDEKLRAVARLFDRDPDEFLTPFRLYRRWSSTPEGRDHKTRIKQAELMEEFTFHGPRWLTGSELKEACAADLFSISRESTDGSLGPEIGEVDSYFILCHCAGPDDPTLENLKVQEDGSFVLPARGNSIVVRTEEKFRLGPHAILELNDLDEHLLGNGIRAASHRMIRFKQPQKPASHFLMLDNISDRDFKVKPGQPIATVKVYFNPYDNPSQPRSGLNLTSKTSRA